MIVTGSSESRLSELRKYTIGGSITTHYVISSNPNVNGVSPSSQYSTYPYTIIYYLGRITYTDIIQSNGDSTTTYSLTAQGTNNPIFIDTPIYQDPKKENIISNPKIDDDVFIVRQALSVQEQNYRLQYVTNLVELTTYAGGNYFNIINNS